MGPLWIANRHQGRGAADTTSPGFGDATSSRDRGSEAEGQQDADVDDEGIELADDVWAWLDSVSAMCCWYSTTCCALEKKVVCLGKTYYSTS